MCPISGRNSLRSERLFKPFCFLIQKKKPLSVLLKKEPAFASPTANRNAPKKRPQKETGGIIKTHIQTFHSSKIQIKTHIAAPVATGSAAIWRDEHFEWNVGSKSFAEEWSPVARRRCVNVLWLTEADPVRSWAAFTRCCLRAPCTEGWNPWSPQTALCRFRSLMQYKTYSLPIKWRGSLLWLSFFP